MQFLSADLIKNEPFEVSIIDVGEHVFSHNAKTDPKIIIGFAETDSWLALNDENYRRLMKLTGTNRWESKWVGTKIFLITEDIKVQGKVKKGIRIKIK
jgi:hypothetical protein